MKGLLFSKPSSSNVELAETFSIGLTLLDLVLLENSQDLYNFEKYRIEYQKLEDKK